MNLTAAYFFNYMLRLFIALLIVFDKYNFFLFLVLIFFIIKLLIVIYNIFKKLICKLHDILLFNPYLIGKIEIGLRMLFCIFFFLYNNDFLWESNLEGHLAYYQTSMDPNSSGQYGYLPGSGSNIPTGSGNQPSGGGLPTESITTAQASDNDKSFSCTEPGCDRFNKPFKSKADQVRHLSTVHKIGICFECPYCTIENGRKDNLIDHIIRVHYGKDPTDPYFKKIAKGEAIDEETLKSQ